MGLQGLEKATAIKFVNEGAKVVLCDVDVSSGEALAAELGNGTSFYKVDVTNRQGSSGLGGRCCEEIRAHRRFN